MGNIDSVYAKIEIICLTSIDLPLIFVQKTKKAASQHNQASLLLISICTFFITEKTKTV